MATKLEKTIKREIDIDGQLYTVAISPDGVKLTQKGYRKGREISWRALWGSSSESGEADTSRGAAGGSSRDATRAGTDMTPPHGDSLGRSSLG